MSQLKETTLQQLNVCEHRFPSAVIVPHGETFVMASWCIRCSEVSFTKYEDDQTDINVEEL